MDTIQEAKIYLRDNWLKGADCPCCGLFVKKYRRKLNSTQCQSIINLYRLSRNSDTYYHITDIEPKKAGTGELSKLIYWGLVENKINIDTNKKCSGFWKITKLGKSFVENKLTVPKYCIVYNKKLLGLDDDETTDIVTALGSKFSYPELMLGV